MALIAMMFVGLLGIVGLSVDIGFVFARQAQLSAAVDAGALAGVTELTGPDRLPFANERAGEFLHAHNLPGGVITTTFDNPANYAQSITILGERQYSLTVTWPVELFFLSVVGIDDFNVQETATAAHFPLADIFASRRVEDGALSTSNQGIFGPHICTDYGDPFSPSMDPDAANFRQTWRGDVNDRTYHYRILIPEDYSDDVVRVELYDPDSINKPNSGPSSPGNHTEQVAHTNIAIQQGMPAVDSRMCPTSPDQRNQKNPCLIPTGEVNLGLDLDRVNLWWFVRSDENRGAGTGCAWEHRREKLSNPDRERDFPGDFIPERTVLEVGLDDKEEHASDDESEGDGEDRLGQFKAVIFQDDPAASGQGEGGGEFKQVGSGSGVLPLKGQLAATIGEQRDDRQDGAGLDDNIEEVALRLEESACDEQVAGGGDGEEFGDSLNDSQKYDRDPVWHGVFRPERRPSDKLESAGLQALIFFQTRI